MPEIRYRVFFNNNGANRQQLERIEEITVEQEVDMVWQARIRIPICLDERGNWSGEDDEFMRLYTHIRVEIQIGEEPFVPLIDGPMMGFENQMAVEPGQSSITLIVQDVSVYLNQDDGIENYENKSDRQIVQEIFGNFDDYISSPPDFGEEEGGGEGDTTSGGSLPPLVVRRGTAMQVLRELARRQGKHVYVLPNPQHGENSIGCFRDFPTETDGIPPLIQVGEHRNLREFNVRHQARSPYFVRASTLNITDGEIVSETSEHQDRELMGDEDVVESDADRGTHIPSPFRIGSGDLGQTVGAEDRRSGFVYEASGSVLETCYHGILQPYRLVTVQAGNTRLSGDYRITKVTHRITPSNYSQSFTLRRNAQSTPHRAGGVNPAREVT